MLINWFFDYDWDEDAEPPGPEPVEPELFVIRSGGSGRFNDYYICMNDDYWKERERYLLQLKAAEKVAKKAADTKALERRLKRNQQRRLRRKSWQLSTTIFPQA